MVDDIMQDRVQVEASETLCRRILAQADESGAVVAEQLVARREITVSTPMEQFSASEERQVRQLDVVINGSSGSGSSRSPYEAPQPFVQLAGVQAARRTLRLDQISGAIEWETEELARLQLSVGAGGWKKVGGRRGGSGTRSPGSGGENPAAAG